MTDDRTFACNATVTNRRCEFRGTKPELSDHAHEYSHFLCRCCLRSLRNDEPAVCDRCTQQARNDLRLISETFTLLPEVIEESGYRTLAFDVLAMSADGSLDSPQRPDQYTHPVESVATAHLEHPEIPGFWRTVTYWRRDTAGQMEQRTYIESTTHPEWVEERKTPDGREHVKDHWPSDPTPVIAVLDANERDWRAEFGHGPALDLPDLEIPTQVAAMTNYLLTWLPLAARTHEGFSEFASEIRSLALTITHRTGVSNDPATAAVQCYDCGGDLISPYREPVHPIPEMTVRKGSDGEGREMGPVRIDPDTGEPYEPEPVWECRDCLLILSPQEYRFSVSAAVQARADAQTMVEEMAS